MNQRSIYFRNVLEIAKKRDKERLASPGVLVRNAFEVDLYEQNGRLKSARLVVLVAYRAQCPWHDTPLADVSFG